MTLTYMCIMYFTHILPHPLPSLIPPTLDNLLPNWSFFYCHVPCFFLTSQGVSVGLFAGAWEGVYRSMYSTSGYTTEANASPCPPALLCV